MKVILEHLIGSTWINSAIAAELLRVLVKTASRLLSKNEKNEKIEILISEEKTIKYRCLKDLNSGHRPIVQKSTKITRTIF